MGLLLGLEPFQKFAVVVVVGGQKAFWSTALVQTLDLGLEAWTKLNKSAKKHNNNIVQLGPSFKFKSKV